jgi:hypothetical protein
MWEGKMKETETYVSVHISDLKSLPGEYLDKLNHALEVMKSSEGRVVSFQVVSVSKVLDQVQFLCYPAFWSKIFPELTESWILTFGDGGTQVTHKKYNTINPPILHHKELYIKDTHLDVPMLREVTRKCEEAGCFEQTIENRYQWIQTLNEKGVEL